MKKPSQITREHFQVYEKEDREYKDRKCLRLLNHTFVKTKKLSLGDYLCRKDDGQFYMVDFLDNKFLIVALYKHIEKHFFPHPSLHIQVGRFLAHGKRKIDEGASHGWV